MAALCSGLWGEVCCAWHHLLYILFHLAVIITVNPLMFDIPSVRQQIVLLLESSQQNTATQRNWMNTICTKTRGQSNLRNSGLCWTVFCGACKKKWRLTDTDLCPCGETQTMSHIVESCPLTKLNGGLSRLHSADEDAVSWLTNYGKWHAYEKKKTYRIDM